MRKHDRRKKWKTRQYKEGKKTRENNVRERQGEKIFGREAREEILKIVEERKRKKKYRGKKTVRKEKNTI